MKTRQLGNTDLHLTEIGFGAWAIGGGGWAFGWGSQDDKDAIEAIRRGVELGINWIDTAAVYGLGHSEKLVAKAVEGMRENLIIATKCSLVWDDDGNISSSLKADSVRREAEDSLRRLGTDYIDLYQIHWPHDDEHIEEGWAEIGKLIEEGKVRYGGVSNFAVEHLERAHKIHPVASLQPPYSMLRRQIESSQMPWCDEHEVGILAYSPMASGLLTGKWRDKELDEDDWRNKATEFNEPNLSVNLWLVDQLRPIAEKYGKTVAQFSVAWTLRRPELTSAIVGARNTEQVEENTQAAGWEIDMEDLDRVEELLAERKEKLREVDGHIPD
jgi:aryl-alcohol dehydrogenase-like predicted oxidoreductase